MKAIGAGLAVAIGVSGMASAQTELAPPARARAVAPDWARKPTVAELIASYPQAASDQGQSGRALIKCMVDTSNRLKNCAILAEDPPNQGFGRAGLKLMDRFEAAPGSAGGEVTVPMNWLSSTVPSNRTALAKNAQFIQTPSASDVIAAFPAAARGHVDKGLVSLRCSARGCVVTSAEPARMGFEDAALNLGKKFKLDPAWTYNIAPDVTRGGVGLEIQYDVLLQFAPADAEVWKKRPLGRIQWVETADPQVAEAAFPPAALRAGLSSGSAVVSCTVASTGALAECGVESEEPQGLGFGPAIARLAERYALNPWTEEGLPAAGAHVRLPMKLVHEPDPSSAATASTARQ